MTLKTVTGPSTQDALADARRLFGADVVLLQSSPGGPGEPASVTVAFDDPETPAPALRRAPPAVPDPSASAAPRVYGYGGARQVRPAAPAPFSAPATPEPAAPLAPGATSGLVWEPRSSALAGPASAAPTSGLVWEPGPSGAPPPADPFPPSAVASGATAGEVAALQARLADLEAALSEMRATAPPPAPARPPLVLVGQCASGKTTLALRLGQSPALIGAERPAVLVVAPRDGLFLDPAPSFWDAGVPVAVVRTADDVAEALRTFADADRLIVDTPGLPLAPRAARAAVAGLGALLAPLADVEVALVVDASRPMATWSATALSVLGLSPDALALTRLDEATCALGAWEARLDLPARIASAGRAVSDVTASTALTGDGQSAGRRPSPVALPSWSSLGSDPAGLVPLTRTAPGERRAVPVRFPHATAPPVHV